MGKTEKTAHPDPSSETSRTDAQDLSVQWQITFDSVSNSVCVLDADWTILKANRATCAVLQLPLDRIIGHKCFELVHGTSGPIENCPVRRIEQSRKRETETFQLHNRWVEISADPIFSEDGTLKGAVHIIVDITERKRAEDALIQSESTLRSIFSAAPTGIGVVCDRVITQANDKLCAMIGYQPDELIGQSARILYPTDEAFETVGREKYAQIDKQGSGTVETWWRHKDGRILNILLSSTPINRDDLSEGVTFTALDITERKHTEEELSNLFEMSLDLICIADINTATFTKVNPAFTATLGFSEAELLKKPFVDFIHPKDRAPTRAVIEEKLKKGAKVIHFENRYRCKNGTYRWLSWVSHPQPDRGITYAIARDVSEQKKMEAQLQQAQKMESIGTLAGGIAHDFNNILSAVIGYTELSLDATTPGSQIEKNLMEIHRAGMRARDLVKQILTFARRAEEDVKPLKVSAIATEALKLLRSTLPTSIEIDAHIQSDALVMADPTQIHQIFMNLCTNAAHAMEYEGGTLRVGLYTVALSEKSQPAGIELEPGDYLNIVVSDTGRGIADQNLALIFEPYFTTKPTGEGTGLGLSVVHGIVKGCGGDIVVKSTPGQETEFSIYLPIIQHGATSRSFDSKSLASGTERILFVDDEEAICTMAQQMLTRLGYQVTFHTDPLSALDLFRSEPDAFDLVITDMTMPHLSGDRLAAAIMAIRPEIPVVLCTGYSKKISDETAARIGIRAFAMKPITTETMAQTVREVLDKANASDRGDVK